MSKVQPRSNFDRLGEAFSKRDWARDESIADRLAPSIAMLPAGRWLDVGCGCGDFATSVRSRARLLLGLDISEAMITAARAGAVLDGLVRADAASVPFRPCAFDAVVTRNLLKHCSATTKVLSEISRVCRNTGRILIVESCAVDEPDRRFMNELIAVAEPRQQSYRTPSEWALAASEGGISVLSQDVFPHRVHSTIRFRTEQFGMDEDTLRRHWALFTRASAEFRYAKGIRQSRGGSLSFLLWWTVLVGRPK
jgi:ubiquinone/menaquinone biosynthesis C-methylase UbiE